MRRGAIDTLIVPRDQPSHDGAARSMFQQENVCGWQAISTRPNPDFHGGF
ncbi:unnamed protein product [Tuwongella immobilis]|uniref:Uncharacterized protein n=1 Tax=Tuwongella immobilis TaxID=692036 RepID=A0A6C2YU97_9BACT|nr:unnamed protein product [Tuwongella immobilis]VTS06805.1 unnamed protein product [Tuwongella immobilis]